MAPEEEVSVSKHVLSSLLDDLDENTRFDRWVEFLSAIILSLATVGTAWCGYQASQWNSQEDRYLSQASSAQLQAAQLTNQAILVDSRNVNLFVEWSSAISNGNTEFADFLYARFPAELAVAMDAWLALKPMENLDAPLSPFDIPAYLLEEVETSEKLLVQFRENTNKANQAGEIADRYISFTVLFASVLFFAGVSGKFKSQVIDIAMLVVAIFLLVIIAAIMFSNPVLLDF
jgi:hypothetical protein